MAETPYEDRQLPDMPTSVFTCEDVDARDLAAAYLAGRLLPDDAAAYEAHYFGCERCWAALRRATELRAAFATAAPATVVPIASRRFRPALAAAAVLAVALSGWLVLGQLRTTPPGGTTRGAADSLPLSASVETAELLVSWRPFAGADSYRVRLFAFDGALLYELETADTVASVPRDSVREEPIQLFWQVQALDALRQPVARSPITPAGPTPVP